MKYILILAALFLSVSAPRAQKVYSVNYESQADVKVYVVQYESQADLNVYKVKYESQASASTANVCTALRTKNSVRDRD
jgi:hypothetical protein